MRKPLITLATLALAASTARADGMYGAGIGVGYGTALVLPTSSSVTTTSLTYREVGGVVGNAILFVGSLPACGAPRTSTRWETSANGATYEITTTTTPTKEAKEICAGVVKEWWETVGKRTLRGEMGQDLQLDIPLQQLGGNTSGVAFSLWRPLVWDGEFVPILGEGSQLWVAQFHLALLTFHNVTSRKALAEMGTIRTIEATTKQDFLMVGSGVRLHKMLSDNMRATLQIDLNAWSIVADEPSPVHLGIDMAAPHTMFHVEVVTSGINPNGYGINAGVILAI